MTEHHQEESVLCRQRWTEPHEYERIQSSSGPTGEAASEENNLILPFASSHCLEITTSLTNYCLMGLLPRTSLNFCSIARKKSGELLHFQTRSKTHYHFPAKGFFNCLCELLTACLVFEANLWLLFSSIYWRDTNDA